MSRGALAAKRDAALLVPAVPWCLQAPLMLSQTSEPVTERLCSSRGLGALAQSHAPVLQCLLCYVHRALRLPKLSEPVTGVFHAVQRFRVLSSSHAPPHC